jgi:ClpX C4-type zinc finger
MWLRTRWRAVAATRSQRASGLSVVTWSRRAPDSSARTASKQRLEERSGVARIGETNDLLKCSFCGKSQRYVRRLIAGPGVYICDQCVDLCCEILDDEEAVSSSAPVRVADMEPLLRGWINSIDTQPITQVRAAKNLLAELSSRLDELLDSPT